nr:immunoglobulin heavy chain junction region [Mus musculus]
CTSPITTVVPHWYFDVW